MQIWPSGCCATTWKPANRSKTRLLCCATCLTLASIRKPPGGWKSDNPRCATSCMDGATWMRILQHQGDRNPWQAMLPADQAAAFSEHCHRILNGSEEIDIWLNGGLGDQLESMARLQAALPNSQLNQRARIVLPALSRPALLPLLKDAWPEQGLPWRFEPGPPRSLNERAWMSGLPFNAALAEAGLWRSPAAITDQFQPSPSSAQILCCWRSKVDRDEQLWAHLRSLPFQTIRKLYNGLIPWCMASGFTLLDISRYNHQEASELAIFSPTLVLKEPDISSFRDTAHHLHQSQLVASVDTAVVHLARWFDWPTLLLLHQNPDERWQPLLRGTEQNYAIQILQQIRYNHWDDVIYAVPSTLSKLTRCAS